jgi:hypothetical protein
VHQRIAQALVERFPEVAEVEPALVAHHYTEAALTIGLSLSGRKPGSVPFSAPPIWNRSVI